MARLHVGSSLCLPCQGRPEQMAVSVSDLPALVIYTASDITYHMSYEIEGAPCSGIVNLEAHTN